MNKKTKTLKVSWISLLGVFISLVMVKFPVSLILAAIILYMGITYTEKEKE